MSVAPTYPPLDERPLKDTICLFDVDGPLTPARRVSNSHSSSLPLLPPPIPFLGDKDLAVRLDYWHEQDTSTNHLDPHVQEASPETLALLAALRQKCAIGFVGGSNLVKQEEQLGKPAGVPVTTLFDFCFSENGLTASKLGQELPSNSFIQHLGEARWQELANFCLHYIADLDIPVKRGTFVEFRNGMANVSPVGRNASNQERADFEEYDKEHQVRAKFVQALKDKFGHFGLTYVFPALRSPPTRCSLGSLVIEEEGFWAELTSPLTASRLAARSRSTSSPMAGTRHTACATSRRTPRSPAASPTRRFTSSATRRAPEATTMSSTRIRGQQAIP